MTRVNYLEKFKFRVFPCITNDKRPAISDWRNKAKVNPNILGNYGVLASGHPYNGKTIVVVDLDNHSEKEESGVQFWEKNDFPSDTFTVETPSGGRHLYFLASNEQIEKMRSIGGFKLHPQIDFFWQDNHYILGVGSVVNGKEYKVINESEPALLPDCVINLMGKGRDGGDIRANEDMKALLDKPKEWKRIKELHEYERKLIISELEKWKNYIADYDEWFALGCSLKNLGFSVEDWKRISYEDERTQRLCEEKWETITRMEENEKRRGLASIINNYLPEWNDLKWRFDKLEDIAIEKAIKMFPNLHKVVVGKDVAIIDDNQAEKGTLMNYKNTLYLYQKKEHRIDYPEKKKKSIVFKKTDGFNIFFRNVEALSGRITNPDYEYGEVEIQGKKFFNDFEKVNLIEGNGTPDLFMEHLGNVCDGNERCFEYLKMWIYSVLLYKRPHTAVCITGEEGVGKSIVGSILSLAFKDCYHAIINSTEDISNRFDGGWKRSFICQIEEACFGSSKNKDVISKLKDLITNDKTTLERKGFDVEKIDNHINFIITSNSPHIIEKGKNSRRWFIVNCNDNHRKDYEYFREMISQMRDGGMAKLVREAQACREQVENFNFLNIPENKASRENIYASAPPMLQWIISKIEEFEPENGYADMPFFEEGGEILMNTNDVIEKYRSDTKANGYLTPKTVGDNLKRWIGKGTEKRKVITEDGYKFLRCFCFKDISELIMDISINYFGDKNALVMGD